MNELQNETAQAGIDDDEISLLDLLQTVAENLRLLILGPLLVGLTALGVSFAIPPTFTAKTSFLPPQQQNSAAATMLSSLGALGALGGLAGAAAGIKNPADQYVAFMKSNQLLDALIDKFDLMNRYEAEYRTNARKTLEGNSRIASGKDGIITVEVDDTDPQIAADMANAYVTQLEALMSRLAVTEAQQRRQFFESQLETTKQKLTEAEIALSQTGVSSDVLKSAPATAIAGVAELQAQVTAQEVRLGAMRGYLAETAPEFKQALTALASLRAQLAKQSQGVRPSTPRADGSSGGARDDYIARYRDFKYQETLFELFARQLEMAKLDESREGAAIQVIDAATAPELKSKPKKALIAVLATLATGFLLLLWVFVRQALKNAAQDAESAQKLAGIRAAFRRALGMA
ncbi:Wzz/FepE/Etk N-terminal domain-containing protein [Rheinheimera sp.]|uniref:Wzz/FepE/Etk N-terminal domain-containing protein n=1 Tax=Rheinheimera sp. TaxID=1869214 RepID=UPI004047064A